MTGGGTRYTSSAWRWIATTGETSNPSPKALADRARRRGQPEARDLTGILLGDPPAGRSALDQKREAEAKRVSLTGQQPLVTGQQQSSIEDLDGGDAGERDEA